MNTPAYSPKRLTEEELEKISKSKVPIPENEAQRIFTLRQTRLLDSSTSDPAFDRFTSFAQRLFNVPVALVTLVDLDRQWFKSKFGVESIIQTHRDHSFCAYTILLDSPEVLVVEDLLLDDRFKDNPRVRAEPFLRFYAGACLILDNMKIGSLCVIDDKPHTGFTEVERMNLLDIASALSHLIAERRDSLINKNRDCAKMMNEIMLNVRSPLTLISSTAAMLLMDLTKKKESFDGRMLSVLKTLSLASRSSSNFNDINNRILEITNTIQQVHTEIENQTSLIMTDLQSSVGRLEVIVESSLCLGQFATEKAEFEKKEWASFTSTNILQTIIDARQTLNRIKDAAHVTWDVDISLLCKGSRHICSPKAVYFLLLNSVEQLVSNWNIIHVRIFFNDTKDMEYDSIVQQLDEVPICDIESIWQQGLLTIEFDLSDKIDDEIGVGNDKVRYAPKSPMSFYSIHQVLEDVEGGFTSIDAGSSYSQKMSFWMPLAIVINEDDEEKKIETETGKYFSFTSYDNVSSRNSKEETSSRNSKERTSIENIDKVYQNIAETKIEEILSTVNADKGTVIAEVDEIVMDSQYLDPFTLNRRSDLSFSDDENSYDQDEGVRLACKKASAAAASKAATDAAFVLSALVDQDLKVAKAEKELKKNKIRFSFRRPNNKAVNPDPSKKEEKINVMSLRILLVDDTLSVQKLMGRWLKNQGCEVTYALNGKIGLHLLKTQQFDICFMDFLMPVMSGTECIKQLNDWSHTLSPIITLDRFVSSRHDSINSLPNNLTNSLGNYHPPLESVNNLNVSELGEIHDDRSAPLFLNKELIMIGISSSASKEELAKAFLHGMHFFCPKPVETVMLASILNIRRKASSLEGALHDISKQASRSSNAGMINNSPTTKVSFNSAESTTSLKKKSSQHASPSDLNLMQSGDYGEVAVTKGTGTW
eukprot:CAMPEP_0119047644 /NCGR_PEP_ID=MMETSP1177-20130426/54324_1 /TAXON_ID=2985 /ORGANISM="Ochromonas sp, Strain CCMP1899" /LENGTH=933 /DNA_ID=CAMNT_0007022477 /DNA_START=162 /DNA_END=2960 /DNA_ORIENTATION=-